MRFGEKLVVFIFRPIYRTFFERLLWWFLTRIKIFFLAEIGVQMSQTLRKLEELQSSQQHWAEIENRLRVMEANNAAQWDGLEQLLLAMFRQPESRNSDTEWENITSEKIPHSTSADLNRVHAAGTLR